MKPDADWRTFIGASLSLLVVYAASATPIPLYGLYRAQDGLSYGDLSLSAVVYFVGAVTALLVLGRLSSHLGRRPLSLLALLLVVLACAVLLNVHSPGPLLVGRLLQGLSCGLASTALSAWVVDSAPRSPAWLAPAITSCGPMVGLTLGGLSAGTLVDIAPLPRQLPFFVVGLMLLPCAWLLTRGNETILRQPGVIASLKPRLALPEQARKAFPVAAWAFVCTWAFGGFYQAFGPAMAREQLHSASALAAALVFASVMAPSLIGASLAGRLTARTAQWGGMALFTLAVGGVLLSLAHGQLLWFLLTSALVGMGQGATLSGSIHTLVDGTAREDRAGILATIYATSYSGAAIPTLIAGQLSGHFSLLQIASAYGVLAVLGWGAISLLQLRQHNHSVSGHHRQAERG
ncbi:MFS transporter [Pokkaliibacter sp. MBI-7]|uniref:MFS transporter n=1 Tax=Pokkaliibacter sp. MBI-7 TaxID=3040600 RepID=UPI002447CF7C|nr:MFS transporter [Pokkaliibacter sp. MBI-7]MDH2431398.1 MFS transporter [Pokkaliibacter sp. MBI-7]